HDLSPASSTPAVDPRGPVSASTAAGTLPQPSPLVGGGQPADGTKARKLEEKIPQVDLLSIDGGKMLNELRDIAKNSKDPEERREAKAALIKFEVEYQSAQDRNEQLVKHLVEINKVIRDQKIVRGLGDLEKKRTAEGRYDAEEVGNLLKTVEER